MHHTQLVDEITRRVLEKLNNLESIPCQTAILHLNNKAITAKLIREAHNNGYKIITARADCIITSEAVDCMSTLGVKVQKEK